MKFKNVAAVLVASVFLFGSISVAEAADTKKPVAQKAKSAEKAKPKAAGAQKAAAVKK